MNSALFHSDGCHNELSSFTKAEYQCYRHLGTMVTITQ